jgi:hypothetical protein
MARTNNTETDSNIVTPVNLAKELGIRPQMVFGWTRSEKLPVNYCVCGHQYLLRDQVATFLAEREAKEVAKQDRIAAELAEAEKAEATEAA